MLYVGARVAVVALVVAGCGTDTPEPAPTDSPAATTTTTTTTAAAAPEADLQVTIADGSVTPTDQRVEATVGEEIVLRVDSDAVDELHVHSVPEYSFEVAEEDGQEFRFTVDVPGQVDVELHDLDVVVVTLLVRP